MSGKKGMGHRNWTKAEKLNYVLRHLEEHVALKEVARESGIPTSRIATWVKKYLEEGEEGVKFAALTTSKNLTEVERLRLLVAKQEIEIARLKKGYFVGCGLRRRLRQEYEIVEELREKYSVNFLCRLMRLNRSGYYKWRERRGKKNLREKRREEITEKLKQAHKKYPSHGYHRLARDIKDKLDYYVSDNLVHLCCKNAGIFSKARNPVKSLPGRENVRFPNLIKGNWNVERPLEIVVSDMTIFKAAKKTWQLVLMIEVFNNEIIAYSLTDSVGSNQSYYDCLEKLKNLIEDEPVILHTDQGAVFSCF